MLSFAKLNNACLNLIWEVQDNHTQNQINIWNEYRFHDYKIENLMQYFTLPKDVKFIDKMQVCENAIYFKDYLGGVYSVRSFYKKYCRLFCSLSYFSDIFFKEISTFKPRTKLFNIIDKSLSIDIAVHLRRGDKISDKPDKGQIQLNELNNLNAKTQKFILSVYKNNVGSRKLNLFIASDDQTEKEIYIKKFKDKFNIVGSQPAEFIEQTYIDLYYLSISKVIVMSMKHSNFSLFASYLNRNTLIYFFRSNKICRESRLNNIILFNHFHVCRQNIVDFISKTFSFFKNFIIIFF